MENESEERKGISAQELIMLSKMQSSSGIQRKGYFETEAIMFILKKLGVTEVEIKQLRINAIRQSKKTAKEFRDIIKNKPLPVNAIINQIEMKLNSPSFIPQTLDRPVPSGSLRVFPNTSASHCHIQNPPNDENANAADFIRGNAITYELGISHTGHYTFSLPTILCGSYFLFADNGPCEYDEYAELKIWAGFTIYKVKDNKKEPYYYYSSKEFFSQSVRNERILNSLLVQAEMGTIEPRFSLDSKGAPSQIDTNIYLPFTAGEILSVELQLNVSAKREGDCAMACADFNPGTGVFWNSWMEVTWVELH